MDQVKQSFRAASPFEHVTHVRSQAGWSSFRGLHEYVGASFTTDIMVPYPTIAFVSSTRNKPQHDIGTYLGLPGPQKYVKPLLSTSKQSPRGRHVYILLESGHVLDPLSRRVTP